MKAVQIMFDEDLLAELDETVDVREKGRSAVLLFRVSPGLDMAMLVQ